MRFSLIDSIIVPILLSIYSFAGVAPSTHLLDGVIMRYSWLDLVMYVLAVILLIPLVVHMGELLVPYVSGTN